MTILQKNHKKQIKTRKGSVSKKMQGPLMYCLALMDTVGSESREFSDFFEANIQYLLTLDDTAADIITLITTSKENHEKLYCLLIFMLDHARMNVENDNPHGTIFIENLGAAINTALKEDSLSFQQITGLARAYQEATLPVPDQLKEGAASIAPRESQNLHNRDFEALIKDLAEEVQEKGGTAYDFFETINSMTAALPQESFTSLVTYIASSEGLFFEKYALYLLLSQKAEVRSAASLGLTECYKQTGLNAQTKKWLPILRSWLPADAARNSIDLLNQKICRKNKTVFVQSNAVKILTVMASIVDGVGAQSIGIGVEQGGRYSVAFLLTKHGYGVKDAFTVPCDSREDVISRLMIISKKTNYVTIAWETLQMLIESALADNLTQENLPAPSLLDVLETCDLINIHPQLMRLPMLLDFVDTKKTIQSASPQTLGRWIKDDFTLDLLAPLTDSWFEDTKEIRQIITINQAPAIIEKKIWAFLENRRDLWARRFLQTAVVYRDADMIREWKTLTASAYGLINGRALKRIPVMENIAYTTIEAGLSNMVM